MAITAAHPQTNASGTHDRLLSAALTIFSRDGLHGATTRAIAQEAGVNEVTLFRHFQTKERLLEALLTSIVAAAQMQDEPVDEAQWSRASLRVNLLRYAKRYYASAAGKEAFVRTMLGEARRYPEHARKIIMDVSAPVRSELVKNLEAARSAGKVRRGVDLAVAADAFMDMLLAGMLRYTAGFAGESTPEQFIATAVDIFAAGLAPKP
ncbi:TetR/AcrR family transcriptional regulator [Verrucomicrobiota bacterium sgz303538]